MSGNVNVPYMGFETKALAREYSFHLDPAADCWRITAHLEIHTEVNGLVVKGGLVLPRRAAALWEGTRMV